MTVVVGQERETVRALVIRSFKDEKGDVLKCVLVRSIKAAVRGEGDLTFPGGGVEENESFEVAIRREMKEEIGLLAKDHLSVLPIGSDNGFSYASKHGRSQRCHFFLVRVVDSFVPVAGDGIKEAAWYCLQELQEIAVQQLNPAKCEMLSEMLSWALAQYPQMFSGSKGRVRQLAAKLKVLEAA
jgi:8-oxo-dGTP pyrophosphatase MutT (NUDIX family)